MPTVFTNGVIHSLDPNHSDPDWVMVDQGRIEAVGTGPPPPGTPYDLAGRTLLPGFQDAHIHPPLGGLAMLRCDLHDVGEPAAYIDAIARYAATHPDQTWILGGGWTMESFPGGVARTELIDHVVPDRPVFLHSRDGHAAWVNTRALAQAGVTAATPDPPDGRIERDADGNPSGTLQEGAVALVGRHAPSDTVDDHVEGIRRAQEMLLGLGITAWQDAWVEQPTHEAYRRLDADGGLTARVVGAQWWDRHRGTDQLEELLRRAVEPTVRYQPTAIKLMVDGVCENGTAALQAPYAGTVDDVGLTFIPPEVLVEAVPAIMAAGVQPHFHAIGDRAIRDALDAVAAGDPADAARVRPQIAHIQVINDADVPRFAELGVVANAQALWACNDACMLQLTAPRLGPERTGWQYRFRDLLAGAARLAFGSDWPVSTADPFEQMAVAVTRQEAPEDEPFLPDQALGPAEVLYGFTMGSAYVNHRDDTSGSITPGKVADLVVATADPLVEKDIGSISVDATFVDGELVAGS